MHIEFLVEDISTEAALTNLLPRLLPPGDTFTIHPHQGKKDLLRRLPGILKGYRQWLPPDYRIVVLIDEDREDCMQLKQDLERFALEAGFATRQTARQGSVYQVLNRIAVEELEAWFFGDTAALAAAYPGVSPTLDRVAAYRDPDAISGGTWEALERVLRRAGHCRCGLLKVETARKVSREMDPVRNRSRSFQAFRNGLMALVAG